MSVQQLAVNALSNPKDREKLLGVLSECSDSLTRVQSEKDLIRQAVKDVCEELELPKRLVNKLVKVYHKQNYDEEVATHEQFESLYETVVKK
jgi:alkylated DNA repair dioxygenase AlkB